MSEEKKPCSDGLTWSLLVVGFTVVVVGYVLFLQFPHGNIAALASGISIVGLVVAFCGLLCRRSYEKAKRDSQVGPLPSVREEQNA